MEKRHGLSSSGSLLLRICVLKLSDSVLLKTKQNKKQGQNKKKTTQQ